MDHTDFIQIGALVVLVALSAYFSASEMAFSTVNRVRLKNMSANGNKRADLVLRMNDDFDKLLTTILIGNNLVNIGSASIATMLLTKHFGAAGAGLSTFVMTVIVLIFGEISPKTLVRATPEKFAGATAPILNGLSILLTPINALFSMWQRFLLRVFSSKSEKGNTEEELIIIVDEAEREGELDEHESDLIRSAIEFNDLDVADILTPRVDTVAIEIGQSMDEIEEIFMEHGFSRLPVYRGSLDDIVGIIHEKDFHALLKRGETSLEPAIKKIIYTVPSAKISFLLRELQRVKTHIAVVVDEFGGTMGIVTLEDILEELVGDIWDEHDEVVEEFTQVTPGAYRVLGSADVDDLFELFEIFRTEEEYDSTTVGGWVVEVLEQIPEVGTEFTCEGLHVTVKETDDRKVIAIEVKKS